MIRPSGGCRPPRGGTLSRGPSSGRAGRPGGCPIASKRTGPLLPPRCGLGIPTVLISDSAISTPQDAITDVLAHYQRRTEARNAPPEAPDVGRLRYRPETLDALFGDLR